MNVSLLRSQILTWFVIITVGHDAPNEPKGIRWEQYQRSFIVVEGFQCTDRKACYLPSKIVDSAKNAGFQGLPYLPHLWCSLYDFATSVSLSELWSMHLQGLFCAMASSNDPRNIHAKEGELGTCLQSVRMALQFLSASLTGGKG